MELDNYRNFLAIVEMGSFTSAANYVHIAQPALSKQLRAMEAYFGAKLIITTRGSRQLLLTDAGHILYQKAKYICSLEDLAKREIDSIMGGVMGTLRFSISSSRSALFIKSSLKAFNQLYPNITYELYEAGIAEQTQQLLNGITEIGIFSTPVDYQDNFEVLFRRDEELVAVYHKDSVWLDPSTESVTLKDLEDIPLSISSGCNEMFRKACADQNMIPHIICVSSTRETALEWSLENAAVSIVPAEPAEKLGDEFVIRKISDISADVYKTVVKVKDRPLSVAAQQFLKFYAKTRNSQQVCDLEELLKNESL
ncbi:LysR family transcriptional regulator [Phascolarctobacterium sp.]|uniref:LysR family transcriptional regulator n=1 Tax=Phascolarctobacterium sp. TaxID=2049039 RepID=UPI00386CD0BE